MDFARYQSAIGDGIYEVFDAALQDVTEDVATYWANLFDWFEEEIPECVHTQ